MEKLKKKKYIALLMVVVLFLTIVSLSMTKKTDKFSGLVKVKESSIESKILGSVGEAIVEDNSVRGNSTVEYEVSFTLDEITGVERRDAIIKASITNEEFKYARFKAVTGSKISSTLIDNGKEIEVLVEDVRLGQEKKIKLKLVIENAPNEIEIHPIVRVREATGEYTNITTDTVTVETNSVEGIVKDENKLPVRDIEIAIKQNGDILKKAYTNSDGKYIITDLDEGTYELDVEEDNYAVTKKETVEVSGRTEKDFSIKQVEPYQIETHKYITGLKLVVDGKEKNYSYEDREEVLETIKKANNISGEITYKLVVKNVGDKAGTIEEVSDIGSEGLKLKDGNNGWEEVEGVYYYRPIEGVTLKKNETREIGLVLEIESTSAAKTYINKMTTKGEIYEKVVYILDGEKYKEEEVLEGNKIEEPIITESGFSGWYTDRNRSNKYNFNIPVNKDLILYGYTEEIKYRVDYIVENEVIESVEVEKGDTVEDIEAPEKTGYTFKYWSLEQDGDAFDFSTRIQDNTTLYGVYEINKYEVTFIDQGNQYGEKEIVNHNEKATVPETNPTREHYTFKYWSLEENGSEYNFDTPVTHNITLYSVYELNKYRVKYIDDGEVIRDGLVDAGTVLTPVAVSKEGYTFRRWSEEPNGAAFDFDNPIYKDTTLYSVYEINHYNVEFYDEGNLVSTIQKDYNTTLSNAETPTVSKEGYTFTFWSLEGQSTGYDYSTPITSNIKLYSNYVIQSRAVIFNDENRLTTVEVEWGNTVSPIGDKGKEGYTFSHWSLEINGTPFNFNTPITEPTTLFAVYNVDTYNINYILNGGSASGNPTTYTIESPDITINNASKTGYTFDGWTEGSESAQNPFIIRHGSTGDKALTAHYTPIEYNITYHLEGGSLEEGKTNPTKYTIESETITLNNPSKTGYTFKGWTGSNGTVPQITTTIPTGSTEDKEYTANYEINKYTVTFIDQGVQYGEIETVNYNETAPTPSQNPSKTGYTFDHWSLEENGTAYNFSTPITEDIVLYSVYNINQYTVTYMNGEVQFAKETVNYNELATAPSQSPTKNHNIFLYWTLNGSPYVFSTPVTENIVLYSAFELVEAPTIDHTPLEWSRGPKIVAITTTHDDYTLYYNVNGGANTIYNEAFPVDRNCTINAYSVKNGISSEEETHEVDKIDIIAPTIESLTNTGVSPVTATINVEMSDAESGIDYYEVYVDGVLNFTSTSYPIETASGEDEYTVTGLEQLTDYVVTVKLYDHVGNASEEDINVSTTAKHYVCRTLDTQGNEIERYELIGLALESTECTNTCHIEMIDNTEESNTILRGQDVTLDINGFLIEGTSANTFTNNGIFTVIDGADTPGKIYSANGKGIYSTNTLTVGINETPQAVSKTEPVIEGYSYGVESTGIFNFYDGKLIGVVASKGEVTETPYLYNTTVKDDSTLNKQVETLTQLAEAEARIKSVYYTKVQGGVDDSKNGSYEDIDYTKPLIAQLHSDSEHRFVYDESTGKASNTNNNRYNDNNSEYNNTYAHSYVKIDLTNYEDPQLVSINAEASAYYYYYCYSGCTDNSNYSYIYVTESPEMPDLTSTEGRIISIQASKEATTYEKLLEPGKEYYLHFVFYAKSINSGYSELFTINDINIGDYKQTYLSDISNAYLNFNDTSNRFVRREDGTFVNNNTSYGTTADSFMLVDLTNVDEDQYIMIDASCTHSYDGTCYIAVTDNSDVPSSSSGIYPTVIVGSRGTTPRDTYVLSLKANQVNYVHFDSYRSYSNYELNNFVIYSVRTVDTDDTGVTDGTVTDNNTYYFEEYSYNPLKWKDSTGHGYDGEVVGASLNADENGYVFGSEDYVKIKKLDLEEFTWQTTFNATGTGVIMANYENGGIGIMVENNKKLREEVFIDGAYRNLYTTEPIEFNRDYTITMTYKDGVAKLYLDGVLQDSYEGSELKHPDSNTVVMLGADPGGSNASGWYFSGTIYNAKIYNRELSDDEITGTASSTGLVLNLDGSNSKEAGKYYKSNNDGVNYSVSNSYMVFDLTNVAEDKYLDINATISSQPSYAIGYITVTDSDTAPSYSDSTGRYVYVSGYSTNDYKVKLTAGQVNYVHFGYQRIANYNPKYGDTFVINSVSYCNSDNGPSVSTFDIENETDTFTVTYREPRVNETVDTVQIIRDITLTNPLEIVETRDVVLDLNGYTLTTSKDDYVIKNNGHLTIIDSKYTGEVQAAIDNYNRETAAYQAQYEQDLIDFQAQYEQDLIDYETTIDDFVDYYNSGVIPSVEETFSYTGSEETFTAPYDGTYKLEVWGASGANHDYNGHVCSGGYGGYSEGEIYLSAGDTLYINVGGEGQGDSSHAYRPGGYNGGGEATTTWDGNMRQSSGGGATSIATESGTLYSLGQNSKQSSVIIVAGGGGGAGGNAVIGCSIGGSGGGKSGSEGYGYREGSWSPVATGGTQTEGGSSGGVFGQGGSSSSAGGGGGYYGGGQATYSAGGGSGFIGYTGLNNAKMVMYGTDESYISTEPESLTDITEDYSENAEEDKAKVGNGYVKITSVQRKTDYTREEIEDLIANNYYTFNYSGTEKVFEAPVTGKYRIEAWGAQGGTINSSYLGGYGSYSNGIVYLEAGDKLYINVGGQGSSSSSDVVSGGYNGGGTGTGGYCSGTRTSASGGGATSIALSSGLLEDFENNQEDLLIVSGGGGGANAYGGYGSGSSAGGIIGNDAPFSRISGHNYEVLATGGTQTSGGLGGNSYQEERDASTGTFGHGGNHEKSACAEGAGGGGGYYGGGGGLFTPGAGGSSYIGNTLVTNKHMTCYNCTTSPDYETKTLTTDSYSANALADTAKMGNGYVRISVAEPELNEAVLKEAVLDESQVLTGNVSSTTNSVILNNFDSYLDVESGIISLNKSGSYNVITNRGTLKLGEYGLVNGLQNNNRGIYNSDSGDIIKGSGKVLMSSTNNIGILNDGVNETEIDGYTLENVDSSSYNFYNRSINDLTLKNITTGGAGVDIYQATSNNLTVNDSTLGSTSNESFTSNTTSIESDIVFNNCNIKNRVISVNNSARNITINDSVMDGSRGSNLLVYPGGVVEINNSDLTHTNWNLENYGTVVVNDSTFTANNHSITTGTDGYFSRDYGIYIHGNTTLNNVDITTKGTSNTYVIYNYDQTMVNGGSVTNESNNSTVFYNGRNGYHTSDYYGVFTTTLTIKGEFETSNNFNRGIYNAIYSVVNIGEDDDEVSKEYPLIQATDNTILNQTTTTFNYYDGRLIGARDNSINGQVSDLPDNYNVYFDKGDTLENDFLIQDSDTSFEDYYVARIGNVKYTTLQGAVDAAPDNTETEIVLLVDLESTSVVTVPSTKKITLNVDNHFIKSYNINSFIVNNGKISIVNDSLNSDVKIIGYSNELIINNGEMNIDYMTINQYTRNYDVLVTNNGNLTINNSEIYTTFPINQQEGNTYSYLTVNSDYLIKNSGNMTINDSTVRGYTTRLIYTTGNLTMNNGLLQTTGESYQATLINNDSVDGVITLNDVTYYKRDWDRMNGAIINNGKAYINGGTVDFITWARTDYTCYPSLFFNNSSTGELYMDGTTFMSSFSRPLINDGYAEIINVNSNSWQGLSNSGTLKINDSTFASLSSYGGLSNSGTLEIDNSTLSGTDNNLSSSGDLTLTNSIVNNTYFHSSDMYNTHVALSLSGSGQADITNNTITGNYGITSSSTGIINLKDNTITANARSGITHSGTGTLNIKNDAVTGVENGLYNSGASIINIGTQGDGTVSKTEPIFEARDYGFNNTSVDSTVNFYDGVFIGNTATSGAFASTETGYSIILENIDDKEHKYLDRVYVVENTRTHEKYYSIQEGIDYASSGDTLEILREVTITSSDSAITVGSSKNVTIDTMGYKFIVGNSTFIENEGTLTITSSKVEDGEIVKGYFESAGSKIIDNSGNITLSNLDIKKTQNSNIDVIYNSGTMAIDNLKVLTGIDGMSSWLLYNDGTLTSTGSIYQTFDTKIIYNNGTINSTNDVVRMTVGQQERSYLCIDMIVNTASGDLTLTNDTLVHASTDSYGNSIGSSILNSGNVVINGGTISETGGRNYYSDPRASTALYNNAGATASITGSTYTGPYGVMARNYGTLNIDGVTSNVVSGVINYADATATIDNSTISGISYDAVNNSGTMSLDNTSIASSGTCIANYNDLDLNDVTFTSTSTNTGTNIISNTGTGTLNITGSSTISGPIGLNNSGSGIINIVTGTITSSNYGIYNTGAGTINIGTTGDGTVSKLDPSITGGNIGLNSSNSSATINFYDGILIGSTALSGTITNVEPNYEIITETIGGNETKYLDKLPLVENTRTHEQYYYLQDGIDDSQNGDTLEFLRNLTVLPSDSTVDVPSGKTLTFDLKGYTITTNNSSFLTNEGILTIDDSTKTASSVGNGGILSNVSKIFDNSGTLTINGGTYRKTLNYTNQMIVNSGKLVINDGLIKVDDTWTNHILINTSGELEINGGEISTYVGTAIENTGLFNLKGGTIIKRGYTYNYNLSPYSFNYYLITSSTTGELNITNGEIIDRGDYYRTGNDNNKNGIYNDGLITITGGSFTSQGRDNSTGMLVTNDTNGTATITGGTFNTSLAGLISNAGTATIRNITSSFRSIGMNSGTLTLDNVTCNNLTHYNYSNYISQMSNGSITNIGDLTITGGSYTGSVLFVSNYGDATITGATFDGESGMVISGSGTTVVDSVDITNGTGTGISISTSGTVDIDNVNITTTGTAIGISNSTTTVDNAIINAGSILSSSGGTIDLTTVTANATSTIFTNSGSGTININDGTYVTTSGNILNSTSTGTTNIKTGTYKTSDGHGINNTGAGTIVIGELGGTPSVVDPYIEASNYGINNSNNNANIYFYDGIISGQTGSVYGTIRDVEPGYKEVRNPNTIDDVAYISSTLAPLGEEDVVVVVNNTNFASLQSAVNYAVANEIATISLQKDLTLEADLVKPVGIDVNIYTNGHTLTTTGYTVDSGINIVSGQAPSGVGGAIYKFLADITGTEINPKNIIVYQMEDGTSLRDDIYYKLYKLSDGSYNIVDFSEDTIGNYSKGGSHEKIYTLTGKLYLNGIGPGQYKLVGQDNREIDFEIYENSVSSNILINTRTNANRVNESYATLILTFGTGVLRNNYILLGLLIAIIVLTLIAIKKKREELV